jgi:dCTP deaminase
MNKSVLSDFQIKEEINNGNIVFYDPNNNDIYKNIQNCSVDITLGEYYYRNSLPLEVYNPWSKTHSQTYWGNTRRASIILNEEESKKYDLPIGTKFIYLEPFETILGHTNEFIGGKFFITTMLKARSSLGRSGITICRDAGWGDIGYINRYTLEITNNTKYNMVLPTNKRIGQIVFFYTGISENTYNGKYQNVVDFQELVKTWKPEMLVPKLYLDK